MSEYVSPLGNEGVAVKLARGIAFLVAGYALIDLAADQLAQAFAAHVIDGVPTVPDPPIGEASDAT